MGCCEGTKDGLKLPYIEELCKHQQILFGVLVFILGVSVILNIYFCATTYTGKRTSKKSKRSQNQKRMEENPIYGNLTLETTQTDAETSFTSSVRRDQRSVNAVSQDCYANLSLKRAPLTCGPSSSLGPSVLEHEPDLEKDPDDAEVRSAVSDLYASVQTKAKILLSPDSEEEYANHL
ncbi:hypothetical protein NQD34_003613 [Periophthalmus magnuspinnatus]|nr:hypothetical protein NQD34_003613 [Periophthalmus magnuspinnatus]